MESSIVRSKDKITRFGLFIWMIKCQIGIGLLSLPSDIYDSADGDSWISVLVAGVVIQLLLIVYVLLYTRMPGRMLSEMTIELLGKPIGRAINFIYFVCFVYISAYGLKLFNHVVHTWLLPKTPEPIILALIVGSFLYLTLQSLSAIERFFTFASILFVIILLFSLTAHSHNMHLSYIMPIGKSGISNIGSGSLDTFFSMIGFEVVLFLMAHVHRDNGKPLRFLPTMTIANVFVTFFYMYFVLLCLLSFSPHALQLLKEPVLFLFKGLSFQLADRLDQIFLSIWIFAMTTVFVGYIYMASRVLSPKSQSNRKIIWVSSIIVYVLGYVLIKIDDLDAFNLNFFYVYLFLIAILPALLLAMSYKVKPKSNVDRRHP
ncbi:GerAB/ArcD/ProY family transporter [Paenibacillus sp. strain BS8-2]